MSFFRIDSLPTYSTGVLPHGTCPYCMARIPEVCQDVAPSESQDVGLQKGQRRGTLPECVPSMRTPETSDKLPHKLSHCMHLRAACTEELLVE